MDLTLLNTLTLFKKDACPFCQKVMGFLQANGIEIPMKDIVKNPEYKDELVEKGGKNQVPCLMIGEEPLYESDDIIQYFKDKVISGVIKEAPSIDGGMCPF